MDHRDPGGHRRVVEDVSRLERVGAVEDDVVAVDDPGHVVRDQHLLVGDHRHVRVERVDRPARRLDLLVADTVGGVDHLALQVREVDDVEVDDADRSHAGGGQVQGRRRAEAAGPDQQHLRPEQSRLAGRPDLGDQQVAAVAHLLVVGQPDGRGPLEALALPGLEAAVHGHDVRVAHRAPSPGRRTATGSRRRSTGRPAASGPGRRPRCPARGSSSRRGSHRARGPAPIRTPRGRRPGRRRRAGGARRPRQATPRGSRRGPRGGSRRRSWAWGGRCLAGRRAAGGTRRGDGGWVVPASGRPATLAAAHQPGLPGPGAWRRSRRAGAGASRSSASRT